MKDANVLMMSVIQFCTDCASASGVNTFCTELDRALLARGVESAIARSFGDIVSLARPIPRASLVLHIHGLWTYAHHRAAVWARQNGVKVVWSTHGMTAPWALGHKRAKKLVAWFLYQRRDLRSAAFIHCTAESEVEWNVRLGLTKTFVVPLGAQPCLETSPRTKGNGGRVLLFVGRIYPVKALDNLIRAFSLAGVRGWTLRIVGPDEGGHQTELVALCVRLGLTSVEFAGPRFGADLDSEYTACDALALVSHTENFGATVVDAMAHGKPVVTSTNTPWREVVERGCGWWVSNSPEPLSAALREMMALSDAEREKMGRAARALVEEKYSWSAVAARMEEQYVLCQ